MSSVVQPLVFKEKDPQVVKTPDGKLWIAGIHVWKEQLTDEEWQKYYAEEWPAEQERRKLQAIKEGKPEPESTPESDAAEELVAKTTAKEK